MSSQIVIVDVNVVVIVIRCADAVVIDT